MSEISEEQLKMYEEAFRAYVKKAAIGNQVGEILEELDEDMKKEGVILYDELDLAAFLQPLISDENEYVLDGARIRCSAMTKEMQEIPDYSRGYEVKHKFSVPTDDEEVLVATTALKSEVNGIKYATIDDRQRFYAEGSQVGMAMSSAGVKPNIYSFGNCRAVTEKDWPAILLNEKDGKKYGTCYCLMKLEEQWENPPCIESALGFASCEAECSIDGGLHTKPMMFSTAKGDREGLTMLATLYCKSKRGIITIETSGQVKMPISIVEEDDLAGLSTDLYIKTIIWRFFMDKGFKEWQVAGIMGNIQQESEWNPLIRSSGRQYWGLFQIGGAISTDLEKAYIAAGLDVSLYGYGASTYQTPGAYYNIPREDLKKILEIQLEFIYECKPTDSDWITRLKKTNSVEEAAECFAIFCEGARDNGKDPENRVLFYQSDVERYYQEVKERREYAIAIYEDCEQYY